MNWPECKDGSYYHAICAILPLRYLNFYYIICAPSYLSFPIYHSLYAWFKIFSPSSSLLPPSPFLHPLLYPHLSIDPWPYNLLAFLFYSLLFLFFNLTFPVIPISLLLLPSLFFPFPSPPFSFSFLSLSLPLVLPLVVWLATLCLWMKNILNGGGKTKREPRETEEVGCKM